MSALLLFGVGVVAYHLSVAFFSAAHPNPEEEATVYKLVAAQPDGSHVFEAESASLPRHIHLSHTESGVTGILASDDPEPPVTQEYVITFDRIGSSVWVDDEKVALFVRRVV